MRVPIFIENPPPFKRVPRGHAGLTDVPLAEGVELARYYLERNVPVSGFHHADLDRFEAMQLRDEIPPERYDACEYAATLKHNLDAFNGAVAPHHVVVYETPEAQLPRFRALVEQGIEHAVLVGKPFSREPAGCHYRTTVEDVLRCLTQDTCARALHLGVIGIHTRREEPRRIVDKYLAAGGRLNVMGQFLDDVDPMHGFLEELAREFDRRKTLPDGLTWFAGLAVLSLERRDFYAKLLRQPSLRCEHRFADTKSVAERIQRSNAMNAEFAGKLYEQARRLGIGLGFSIQPIIERYMDGAIHPAINGAAELAVAVDSM